jgi:predicted RNA-binding Zn-ribbon protein involved in translation (DUF1610 family)
MPAQRQHCIGTTMTVDNETLEIGPHDVVFECPACAKSMAADEDAEGLTVDCPGCGAQVIVPSKPGRSASSSASSAAELNARLSLLVGKLRELQMQRTEISNNIIARLNDINRLVVMLARLEASHQQVMQEWNRILADAEPSQTK